MQKTAPGSCQALAARLVSAPPAINIASYPGTRRSIQHRTKSAHLPSVSFCLHHQQRTAAKIAAWYQQEAWTPRERVQFICEAVATERGIAAGEPATVSSLGHYFHVSQGRTLTALLCWRRWLGLASGKGCKCGNDGCTCKDPHAAIPRALSNRPRPSVPPWAASMRFSG